MPDVDLIDLPDDARLRKTPCTCASEDTTRHWEYCEKVIAFRTWAKERRDMSGIRSRIRSLDVSAFLSRVEKEVESARLNFPSSEASMVALVEEVGELSKALLDEPWDRVVAEAIQVAAMACRVACEGDPTLDAVRNRRLKGLPR